MLETAIFDPLRWVIQSRAMGSRIKRGVADRDKRDMPWGEAHTSWPAWGPKLDRVDVMFGDSGIVFPDFNRP